MFFSKKNTLKEGSSSIWNRLYQKISHLLIQFLSHNEAKDLCLVLYLLKWVSDVLE